MLSALDPQAVAVRPTEKRVVGEQEPEVRRFKAEAKAARVGKITRYKHI